MKNTNSKQEHLIGFVFTYWKIFAIVFVIALIASIIFSSSWFITPEYKSTSVLYPSNLTSYSTETETEQMLQFFESNAIRDSIIERFDLASYYGIDKETPYFKYKVYTEFDDHVSINRTEYESVQIDVLAKDPIKSYEINNAIIEEFNKKVDATYKTRAKENLKIKKELMDRTKERVDSIFTKLQTLSKDYNLVDVEVQIKEAYRGLFNSASANTQYLQNLISNIEEKSAEFKTLAIELENIATVYAEAVSEYENAEVDVNKKLMYSIEVVSPYPPDKKAYPIRWIIILVSVLSSFLLVLFLVVIFEQYRNWKENA